MCEESVITFREPEGPCNEVLIDIYVDKLHKDLGNNLCGLGNRLKMIFRLRGWSWYDDNDVWHNQVTCCDVHPSRVDPERTKKVCRILRKLKVDIYLAKDTVFELDDYEYDPNPGKAWYDDYFGSMEKRLGYDIFFKDDDDDEEFRLT